MDCINCNKAKDTYCSYWKEKRKYHKLDFCTGYEKQRVAPIQAVVQEHELRIVNHNRPANVQVKIDHVNIFGHKLSDDEIKIILEEEIGAEMSTGIPKPLGFTTVKVPEKKRFPQDYEELASPNSKCSLCTAKVIWSASNPTGICLNGHPLRRMTIPKRGW